MIAMTSIPPKKEPTVTQLPAIFPSSDTRESCAFTNISIIETYIITPAEKPRLMDKNFLLVCFAKNAIQLPIPVLNPAINVRANARKTLFISFSFL